MYLLPSILGIVLFFRFSFCIVEVRGAEQVRLQGGSKGVLQRKSGSQVGEL